MVVKKGRLFYYLSICCRIFAEEGVIELTSDELIATGIVVLQVDSNKLNPNLLSFDQNMIQDNEVKYYEYSGIVPFCDIATATI